MEGLAARTTHRLSQSKVDALIRDIDARRTNLRPHRLADGGGLYLKLPQASYVSFLRFGGRRIEPGHGSARKVKLAEAREAHEAALRVMRANVNPVTAKLKARQAAIANKTFVHVVRAFLPVLDAEVSSPKTRAIWRSLLLGEVVDGNGNVTKAEFNYCTKIHHVPIGDIDVTLILAVLEPLWFTRPAAARRLRGMIERALGWGIHRGMGGTVDIRGWRNPAAWGGNLELTLSAKKPPTQHHAALPHGELPAFYVALSRQPGIAARALQFAILTATRTGDIRGVDRDDQPPMRWEHVDIDASIWTIPRTKTDAVHRIPLSTQAVALLLQQGPCKAGVVFPGTQPGKPLSTNAMRSAIERMEKAGLVKPDAVTPHGMARAGFKSWASDETDAEHGVIEACMSHVIGDKIEAAYRRTDFYAKRAKLMQDWADYVTE